MIRRTLLLAAALMPVAAVCAAQAPPQSAEDKAANVTFGPFTLQPSLALRDIGRDPNVFNEATNPRSDFTFTVSPTAVITFKASRFKTVYTQKTDYVYYKTYTSERGTSQSNDVRVELDLGSLTPFAGFTDLNAKSRVNNEIDARARHVDRDYTAGTSLKLFTRTVATVTARQKTQKYDQRATFRGESLADAFNGTTTIGEASVGTELTPFTTASVVVSKEQSRFDLEPQRNSDTFRVMPKLTFSPLGLVNGTAAFGYRKFTPLDPATPPFAGFVALTTAGVTLFDHHRIDTAIVRDVSYSYDEASTYFIQNSVGVTWTYAFAGPFDSKLGATRNLMHYHRTAASAGGDDRFTSYTAGLGYRIRKRLRIGVNGDLNSRRSAISADRQFDDNRVYGTLTWGG